MKKYFSIGEAAKAVNMTSETLRHYDRAGLVQPGRKDKWTNYRYYTEQDIILLNTVRALRQMDLPLKKIKEVLAYDDLQRIIDFMDEAERRADEKIASIQYAKARIQSAKRDYEKKLQARQHLDRPLVKRFPKRIIMLSDTMEEPALDNLWNYLSSFYGMLDPSERELFEFKDLAGVYTADGVSKMYAVCVRCPRPEELVELPGGNYLCAECAERDRRDATEELLKIAADEYGVSPRFILQEVIVSGILQWRYQIQLPIDTAAGNGLI